MTDVILFHHAQGLTDGVREFAGVLRAAGHQVTVPDLYGGETFGTLDEGVAYAQQTGFDVLIERGRRAADRLPAGLVCAGFSLGVLPAQSLAQTRPGARGALLFHACADISRLAGSIQTACIGALHQWGAGLVGDSAFRDRCVLGVDLAFAAAAADSCRDVLARAIDRR
jgi:dienelactone hydrolase